MFRRTEGDRPERVAALFAAGKIGAIMAPLNFRLAPPELAYMVISGGENIHPAEVEDVIHAGDLPLKTPRLA